MASLKEKFVEELDYLRRLGRVFSRKNPALEPFLGTSARDADVERLLEGCAFLTAKLRLKTEDDLPETTLFNFHNFFFHSHDRLFIGFTIKHLHC